MAISEIEITEGPGPRHIFPIEVNNAGTDQLVWGRDGWLMAYHIVEPTATSGVDAEFRDSGNASGTMLIPAYLIAGRAAMLSFFPQGVPIRSGLFLHMIAGQLRGTLWIATERRV